MSDENRNSSATAAGIRLADKPSPLFELFVLTQLLSHRISSDIAVAAARELIDAGYTTAAELADADWQDVVDALGRGRFKRYDESTATRLIENAKRIERDYRGDLRNLGDEVGHDGTALARKLQDFTGIGPTGADIFRREVHVVWSWARPS